MPQVKHIEDHLAAIKVVGAWSCWKLPNKPHASGYVYIAIKNKDHRAHRAVYEKLIGPIPHGHVPDHLCRHRWCCNPNHVTPVTHRVNTLRGSSFAARNAAKTRCPRGHLYTKENTYVWNGYRYCRRCHRRHTYKYWKKSTRQATNDIQTIG